MLPHLFEHASTVLRRLSLIFLLFSGAVLWASSQAHASAFLIAQRAIEMPMGFAGVCERYAWACKEASASASASAYDRDDHRIVRRINLRVNNRVREITDQAQYRREEFWSLPTHIGGDCEDFALLKKKLLIAEGISPDRLMIAEVLDRNNERHAVLVVRTDRGDFVLDNLTNRIKHWEDTGYTFLRMQNPDRPSAWDAVFAGGLIRNKQG